MSRNLMLAPVFTSFFSMGCRTTSSNDGSNLKSDPKLLVLCEQAEAQILKSKYAPLITATRAVEARLGDLSTCMLRLFFGDKDKLLKFVNDRVAADLNPVVETLDKNQIANLQLMDSSADRFPLSNDPDVVFEMTIAARANPCGPIDKLGGNGMMAVDGLPNIKLQFLDVLAIRNYINECYKKNINPVMFESEAQQLRAPVILYYSKALPRIG